MNLPLALPPCDTAAQVAAVARLYGEPLHDMPRDLYIPPDALEVILEAFEGPLDLLLYLIRRSNLDVLDIPMAPLTAQYLVYVDAMRRHNLELAADYLLMAATLLEIKSRMLLPKSPRAAADEGRRAARRPAACGARLRKGERVRRRQSRRTAARRKPA